ncbi:ATP-binding protein [Streptomyces sp. NPDC057235]|uniref:ATP-binding protein n=1 Tax=Streptomyces sp. NPDC057235 TaxID=3346058 RepID=UPI00362CAC9D
MSISARQPQDIPFELQGPVSPAQARDRVRSLLSVELARPPQTPRLNDLLLVVSELVTNAVRHGGGTASFAVRVDPEAREVVVDVADHSTARPTTGQADTLTPGGFGWPIITRLSADITITPLPGGKNIRVLFAL